MLNSQTLTTLGIFKNGMGDDGIKHLMNALQENQVPQKLENLISNIFSFLDRH